MAATEVKEAGGGLKIHVFSLGGKKEDSSSQRMKITEILHDLYKTIAEPLAEIESRGAVDSTGIRNQYGNKRWSQVRHTKEEAKERKNYNKLHILSGVKTNIICSAIITDGERNDSPLLEPLLLDASKRFDFEEISADAGYISKKNVKAIHKAGAFPFIKPRKNVAVPSLKGRTTPWGAMLNLFKNNQIVFAYHYNFRQNVESTFSALERKFGNTVRSKNSVSKENEMLCKLVCYNASVLAKTLIDNNLNTGFIATK